MVRGMRRSCAKVQVSLRVPSIDVSIVPISEVWAA